MLQRTLAIVKPDGVQKGVAGQVIVGTVVSRTITRCEQVFALPLPSVTVQVTTFVPSA